MTAPARLTPRQLQVLRLVANGYRTREIAEHLGVVPATVKFHLRCICDVLGARTNAHAVVLAYAQLMSPRRPA